MGQEQSVPTQRRAPNKLSKPRTHTAAATIASKSNLQLEHKDSEIANGPAVASRYSLLSPEAVAAPERLKDEKQHKQNKRRSLFRSKNSQAKDLVTLDTGVAIKFVPDQLGPPVPRWSSQAWLRSNSLTEDAPEPVNTQTARPPNRARMSLQHIPYAQHHPRLSLVAETPPAERLIVDAIVPQHLDDTAAIQTNSQQISRTNSDVEEYGPIRRRSLLQHGVATRPSLPANLSRQSLPPQIGVRKDAQSYYQEPPNRTPSPLTNFAPMRRLEAYGGRVETPDELDYRHTGAFKLGSLRITNGVASPSPSADRSATGPEDDYISAGNGRRTFEGYQCGDGESSSFSNLAGRDMDSRWAVRSGSPLRNAYRAKADLTIVTSAPLSDPSLALFDFDTKQKLFGKGESPTRSQELANEYMQDLAFSPFSFDPSQPNSPVLEATSKHTAIEDELFDAEPATPSLLHRDSGYGSAPKLTRGPRDQQLAKADSGYSSNVSLRSFRTSTSITPAPPVPAKEVPPTPPKDSNRIPSSTYSISSVGSESTIRKKDSLPALPLQDSDGIYFQNDDPANYLHSSHSESQMVTHWMPMRPSEQMLASTLNQQRSRQSSLPLNSSDHDFTESLNFPGRRSLLHPRNEKRRPQPIQPQPSGYAQNLTRQNHDLERVPIPPVSYEASNRLENRVDAFPTKSFPNTVSGLRKSSSKETLGTIFSVGSGYTDVPMTRERLESALPAPPPPERKPLKLHNSYQPPATPPKRLQKKLFTQDQDQSFGEPIEDERLRISKRAMSLSSEVSATQYTMSERNVSGDSWTSTVTSSTVITARKSFESIARGNPWGSRSSSFEHPSRVPQVPALATLPSQRQYLDNDECKPERRLSYVRGDRKATPPQVAMQTQRKAKLSSEGLNKLATATKSLASRESVPQTQPSEIPPPPPPHTSQPAIQGPQLGHTQDHWSEHMNFWADRRKSAGEALQLNNRKSVDSMPTVKSMGTRRPPSTHQNNNIKMRKSLDVVRARTLLDKQFDVSPNLRQYDSFDNSQRPPKNMVSNTTGGLSNYAAPQDKSRGGQGEYNHAYGRVFPNKENRLPSPEKEYFDPEDLQSDHLLLQSLHQSQNSTSDMLILDRFIGGLDYGYEPGYGLGGSAGTRNVGKLAAGGRKSVDVSRSLGLDFSDVPIILQRVRAKA